MTSTRELQFAINKTEQNTAASIYPEYAEVCISTSLSMYVFIYICMLFIYLFNVYPSKNSHERVHIYIYFVTLLIIQAPRAGNISFHGQLFHRQDVRHWFLKLGTGCDLNSEWSQ